MKKSQVLFVPLLIVIVLMMGMAVNACGNAEETSPVTKEVPEVAVPVENTTVTPEEKKETQPTLPTPGEWTAITEFGELVIIVSPDSKGISMITLNFSGNYSCEGRSFSGTISNEFSSPCSITDGQFTVDIDMLMLGQVTIKGSFDKTGKQASGTWEIRGECTGTWESP